MSEAEAQEAPTEAATEAAPAAEAQEAPQGMDAIRAQLRAQLDQGDEADAQETQEAKPEATEAKPEAEKTPRISKAIAELHRREAALRKKEKEISEAAAKAKAIEEAAQRLKEGVADPDDLLSALGVNYRAITEAKLRHGKPEPDKSEQALSEVEKLRAELAAKEEAIARRQAELEEQEFERAHRSEIDTFLSQNADKYDAIRSLGYEDKIAEMRVRHYQQHGEALTYEQAADSLESLLVENVVSKILKTKYASTSSSQASPGKATSGNVANSGKSTLTNKMAGTVSSIPDKTTLSLEEARAAVRAMFSR